MLIAPILESKEILPAPKSISRQMLTHKQALSYLQKTVGSSFFEGSKSPDKFFLADGSVGLILYHDYAFLIAYRPPRTNQNTIKAYVKSNTDGYFKQVAVKEIGNDNPKERTNQIKDIFNSFTTKESEMFSFKKFKKTCQDLKFKWIASSSIEKTLVDWKQEEKKPAPKNSAQGRKEAKEAQKSENLSLTVNIMNIDSPKAIEFMKKVGIHYNDKAIVQNRYLLTDQKPGKIAWNDCCIAIAGNSISGAYMNTSWNNYFAIYYRRHLDGKPIYYGSVQPSKKNAPGRMRLLVQEIAKNMGSREKFEKYIKKIDGFFVSNEKASEIQHLAYKW